MAISEISSKIATQRERLAELFRGMGQVVVAFSAGVDSTVVLKMALNILGPDHVLAATGVSASLAHRELQSVKDLASLLKAPLRLIQTSELEDPNYAANPANRCYFCKSELYTRLKALAEPRGATVCNGVNLDDAGEFRPGLRAAEELSVRAPLLEAGMTKADVRALAASLGLPNWSKPALACLSSRIPYGTPVTIASLSRIERAEAFLWERGFRDFRVRHHQQLARIEVLPDDFPRLIAEPLREELLTHFKRLGYTYISLDLAGFRSGSGNEVLNSMTTMGVSRR